MGTNKNINIFSLRESSKNFKLNITKNEVKESFIDTFNISISNKLKIYLFLNCRFKDFDYIRLFLINNENWVYYYYIPNLSLNDTLFFNNLLLICVTNEFEVNSLNNLVLSNFHSNSYEFILNFIVNNIDWCNQDVYTHSCQWVDQVFFGEYIDCLTGGDINLIPHHWFQPRQSNDISLFIKLNKN
jgi:hypothetical protein